MSKQKEWPVFVHSPTGTDGCGHQHKTALAAYNCGNRQMHVVKLTRGKRDKHGNRKVTREVMI